MSPTAIGVTRRPASSAVKSSTPCRYWVRKKIVPNIEKNTSVIAALAPEKRGLRNSRMSSIGWDARISQAMNAPRTTAARPNAARIVGFVQPRAGASMIAHTSVVRPAIDSAKPGRSRRGADGSLDSGTSQRPAVSAATTNGRLTRKIAFQLACSISQPPATGPMAMPSPETPAQMPIAFARSLAGKTAVMIDSVEGMMNAPPMPIRARVAISISGEVASADSPEPRPKMARPIVRPRLRPKRSPSAPAVSSRPAKTSM